VPQGGAAANAITIEFREFGIRLNFTPVVLGQQRVRLRIAPEISATDFTNAVQIQGTVVPVLTQRKTETTVEIGNGQTIAIAGLLNEEVRGVATRIPGLGDIPVIGALFRSVEYQKRLTELVVLVTPEIVAPMDPHQVPQPPAQNVSDPNDWQFYGLGMLEGEPHEDNSGPADALRTDIPKRLAPTAPADQAPLRGPFGTDGGDAR
jgi:pilus assembly protein CpaC